MAGKNFTHALVCRVPQGFCPDENLEEAKEQHEEFVTLLRDLGLDVIELPPDPKLPQCVYVEDTAVVINGTALIARLADTSRKQEAEYVRAVLRKELQLHIEEISDENAKLAGGDVLWTGRELFVGLSEWTNLAGARAVAATFPEFPTTPITVPGQAHLKDLLSMAGHDLLAVSGTKDGQEVAKRVEREATFSYATVTVPEETAANVLYINGTLVRRCKSEIPDSHEVFQEKIDFPQREVKVDRLVRKSNNLSSLCLLLRRTKHIRHL